MQISKDEMSTLCGIKVSAGSHSTPSSSNIFVVEVRFSDSLWSKVYCNRGEDAVGEVLRKGGVMHMYLLLVVLIGLIHLRLECLQHG